MELVPPKVVRVVVGVDNVIASKISVANFGTEPSYDALLRILSPIELPLPREFECQKLNGGSSNSESAVKNRESKMLKLKKLCVS